MTNPKVDRKDVLSMDEVDMMLDRADVIKDEYFRLRAKALVSVFKTGKRRASVSTLEMDDLEVRGDFLYLTFTVVKKRKKRVLSKRRTKRFPLSSRYAQYILAYWRWMREHHPECKYLFPSTHNVFGLSVSFSQSRHLSGRQILRIIKNLNEKAWCHLFRETRGAEIVKRDEAEKGQAGLETVFKVKMGLDLERETTAWNYVRRFMTETIRTEEETIT
jgi:hypothetical protein